MGSDTMIGTMIGFMDNHFINKLLGRNTDFLYTDEAKSLIKDKVVLVTGGGGSIGGEIVQQAINLGAKDVYCVDQDEFALYNLQLKLTGTALLTDKRLILADIRNEAVVDKIFSEVKPDIVYHAAANKHLPLLERSPMAAFYTNVIGTKVIANACIKHAVKVFINISTDKAARPTSVLGITKRIAEYITSSVAVSSTRVASVRFGNVLGSRGSFLPTLAWQIQNNQTVSVTHPDITRYFMTIPEAAALVIEASVLAKDGETYVLDMGTSIKILDLIERYVNLVGSDMPEIIFTGLREGEKMHEELYDPSEMHMSTEHPQISKVHVGQAEVLDLKMVSEIISTLDVCSSKDLKERLHSLMREV